MIRRAALNADGSVTCGCGLVIHFLPDHPHDETKGHEDSRLAYGPTHSVNHQGCAAALPGPRDDTVSKHVDGQPSPAGPDLEGKFETINRLDVKELDTHYGDQRGRVKPVAKTATSKA